MSGSHLDCLDLIQKYNPQCSYHGIIFLFNVKSSCISAQPIQESGEGMERLYKISGRATKPTEGFLKV